MTLFDDLRAHRAAQGRRILDLFDDPGAGGGVFGRRGRACCSIIPRRISTRGDGLLIALAEAADVPARREAMFAGAKINETEGRAVLHTALARRAGRSWSTGSTSCPGVLETRARMEAFATDIRSGAIAGAGGPYTDVVNIGIGGSDLGPAMATLALAPYHDGPRLHYVSNVDGAHIHDTLKGLDPRADAGDRGVQDLHHHRDDDQRRRRGTGWRGRWTTRPRSSRRCRAPRTRPAISGSTRPASSASRIGSAGAIRSGGPSGWA
jgi:glucose-6-phosphate isomerase